MKLLHMYENERHDSYETWCGNLSETINGINIYPISSKMAVVYLQNNWIDHYCFCVKCHRAYIINEVAK